jgi:hypothetical protein
LKRREAEQNDRNDGKIESSQALKFWRGATKAVATDRLDMEN